MEPATRPLSQQLTDLEACDREPVNFIGSVQAHGCLICFTLSDRRVQAASTNVEEFFAVPHREVVSFKLDHVLGAEFSDEIIRAASSLANSRVYGLDLSYARDGREFDVYVYRTEELFCVEFQRAAGTSDETADGESIDRVLRDCMLALRDSDQISDLGEFVCRGVRALSGMDRVMLYRFLPETWHGEVIAEDRVMHSHSFMHHRFPASDIPRVARDLYLRNGVRMIPDVTAPIFEVKPSLNPKTRGPLDLSDSRVRAVSPIHLEYLKNMKIAASYSFAIVSKGQLWGLIACHHFAPLIVSRSQRAACETIANTFAAQAPLIEMVEKHQRRISFDVKLRQAIDVVRYSSEPSKELLKNHVALFDIFDATGVAIVAAEGCDFAGLCPTVAQLSELRKIVLKKMQDENKKILSVQSLVDIWPDWQPFEKVACGMLAIRVEDVEAGVFMIFRPEQIETIRWGGDPRKQLDKKGFSGRINPRLSFDAWEETVRGHSADWCKFEIEGARFLKEFVFETLTPNQKLIRELGERKS